MPTQKLVVFGGGGVGKSAISGQFISGEFCSQYDPTIIDVFKKMECVDGDTYTLEIVDTAGQEEYASLRSSYYQKGEGFIAVYSICERKSFEEVQKLRDDVLQERSEDSVPLVLIGNKCDLEAERQVSKKEGEAMAAAFFGPGKPVHFFECSAKDNINVKELFHEIVRQVSGTGTTPGPKHADPAVAAPGPTGQPGPDAPAPPVPDQPEPKKKPEKKKKKKKCLVM